MALGLALELGLLRLRECRLELLLGHLALGGGACGEHGSAWDWSHVNALSRRGDE